MTEMTGDQWLMGALRDPVISWKDRPIGYTVKGTIVKPSDYVQRRDDDGDLEWWDEAKTQPKMQLIVHLKTGEIKADHEDHTGVWRLFVASKGLKDAVSAAVKRAGVKALALGGELAVTYKGEGQKAPTAKKTHNPPKLFHAEYMPPLDSSAALNHSEPNALEGLRNGSMHITGQQRTGFQVPAGDEPPF